MSRENSELYLPEIVPESDREYVESQPRYGNRVGWGENPAVLVVDMTVAFVEERRTGEDVVESTARLLETARAADVPVFHAVPAGRGAFPPGYPVPIKAAPGTDRGPERSERTASHEEWVEKLDRFPPAVEPAESDHVVEKPRASAFFDTHLSNLLHHYGIDTLVVCGTNTSGCVRATVVDGHSSNFRTIVPEECVAGVTTATHEVALFDMDLRYADVTPLDDVVSTLETLD